MAKSGVSINWGGLDKCLESAVDVLKHKQTELLDTIGEAMVSSTKDRFKLGVDPDGTPWKPSQRALIKNGKTLVDTGRLRDSISSRAAGDTIYVGTNHEGGRLHQYGGVVKPKKGKYLKFKGINGKDVFVKKVTIPKRSYLGINQDDLDEAAGIIGDFLEDSFAGKG